MRAFAAYTALFIVALAGTCLALGEHCYHATPQDDKKEASPSTYCGAQSASSKMHGIIVHTDGSMAVKEMPAPEIKADEILVRVKCAGVNRLDLLQRAGKYPPPPGDIDILGIEVSGIVEAIGSRASGHGLSVGDRVCGLVPGGGYAEQAAMPVENAMRMPSDMTFAEGASIPEAWLTAYAALHYSARMRMGDTILLHAAASGVGTAAIQVIRAHCGPSCTIIAIAGSEDKLALCKRLGATHAINRHTTNFADFALSVTNNRGVDVVLDFVGGSHFADNVRALGLDGRMVMLGLLGGPIANTVDVSAILRKRLTVVGSTLRNRPRDYKARLASDFSRDIMHMFEQGTVTSVIDGQYPLERVAEAHERMQHNHNGGKIILNVSH